MVPSSPVMVPPSSSPVFITWVVTLKVLILFSTFRLRAAAIAASPFAPSAITKPSEFPFASKSFAVPNTTSSFSSWTKFVAFRLFPLK